MATCTHKVGSADSGTTPNDSGAFTPALGDLLIVLIVATGTGDATATVTNSAGMTFSLVLKATYGGSAHAIFVYVANALVTSAISQTITVDMPADPATGTFIFVNAVAGMSRVGTNAIRQSAKQDSQAAGTPAPAFAVAALTGNPTLGIVGNLTNPATMTPPTGWTEDAGTGDRGYTSPTAGAEYAFRNSGFTGTTITWGSASDTEFGALIVELDASAADGQPTMARHQGVPHMGLPTRRLGR